MARKRSLLTAAWALVWMAALGAMRVAPGWADPARGPAPTVQTVELKAVAGLQPQEGEQEPEAQAPNHPPIALIPPIPMPDPADGVPATGPSGVYVHDPVTGQTVEVPLARSTAVGPSITEGYRGADGGAAEAEMPAGFGDMTRITNGNRSRDAAAYPNRDREGAED